MQSNAGKSSAGIVMERSKVGQQRDLGQILLDGALLRPEDLAAAQEIARNTGRKLPIVLLENKFVIQETLYKAPVVKAVDMLLTQAVKDRASDIHLEPQEKGFKVKYRIDGILHEAVTLPPGVQNAIISRIKIMSNMNIAEKRRSQDGQMSTTIGDKQIDFRVATIETFYGEMMVIRVLDKSSSVLNISASPSCFQT